MRPANLTNVGLRLGLEGEAGGLGLDRIDLKLMAALMEDGRESFRAIARSLDVSETTIRTRYRRLREAGILSVQGSVDPAALGFEAEALLGIRASTSSLGVSEQITAWPEVTSVVATGGRFDLLAEVLCPTRSEMLEVANRVRTLAEVSSVEVFVYLQEWRKSGGELGTTTLSSVAAELERESRS